MKKLIVNMANIYGIIIILLFFLSIPLYAQNTGTKTLWLDELGVVYVTAGWGTPHANKSIEGNPITIGGKVYDRGIGTHANSYYRINLDGKAVRFTAFVGIDDEVNGDISASVEFIVNGLDKDGNSIKLWTSGVMEANQLAEEVDVNIEGYYGIELIVTDAGDGNSHDHADWAEAKIEHLGNKPEPEKPWFVNANMVE